MSSDGDPPAAAQKLSMFIIYNRNVRRWGGEEGRRGRGEGERI